MNPTTVLILGFVTCGLYRLYWMWIRVKEMNEYLGKQEVNPMFVFPGCICYPVVFYATWLFAENGSTRCRRRRGSRTRRTRRSSTCILLILLSPVGKYLVKQRLNELWAKAGVE